MTATSNEESRTTHTVKTLTLLITYSEKEHESSSSSKKNSASINRTLRQSHHHKITKTTGSTSQSIETAMIQTTSRLIFYTFLKHIQLGIHLKHLIQINSFSTSQSLAKEQITRRCTRGRKAKERKNKVSRLIHKYTS